MDARRDLIPFSEFEVLRHAREVIEQEANCLLAVARRLDTEFHQAVRALTECRGSVVVTGVGKAGLIARKIVATLASTGTRAHFLHPTEAVHGDLGCVGSDDLVLALSNSGETDELCRLLPIFENMKLSVIAITSSSDNTLARHANIVVSIGRRQEAGELALAPSVTTTAMLALGDALALSASRLRQFTTEDFATLHPAGSLGRKLARVRDVMRHVERLRFASEQATVREVFTTLNRPGRRTGAVMLLGADGTLTGLFTDSDLARLIEARRESEFDRPIREVMTRDPVTIDRDAKISDAVSLLSDRKLSELPVVSDDDRPVGLIDITDIIGLTSVDVDELFDEEDVGSHDSDDGSCRRESA